MNHKINRNGRGIDRDGNRLCDPICRLPGPHSECRGPRGRVGRETPGKDSKAAWKAAKKSGTFTGPLRAYRRELPQ